MKKNSIKNTRINKEVAREMSEILRKDLKDPRVDPIKTSVMEALVTPDLKYAKIFVSVFGSEPDKENTMNALKHSSSYIRHLLAQRLNLRNTPELTFLLDESIEYAAKMSQRIEEVRSMESKGEE